MPGLAKSITLENQADFFDAYLADVSERLQRTRMVCFAFGAIRSSGSFRASSTTGARWSPDCRGYIPPFRGCLARWVVRVANWCSWLSLPFP